MNDPAYLKKIGMKLRILRSLKDFSQDDLANKLDIDKSYYSKVERGLANPTILYLKHLSELFEVSISDLIDLNISL